jgi:NitT/TauT family transport system substrate-binding protein
MRRSAVLLAAAALTLASCDIAVNPDRKAGFDKVTVGAVAGVDAAPLFLGQAKGIFDKQKIDLTITPVAASAAGVTGVVGGQFTFGFANTAALLTARAQGQDVKIVANGASSTGKPGRDFSAVLVKGDSDIKTAAGLGGKTIAINQLKNMGDTTVRASVRKAGGDPTKIKFVEKPFAEASAALDSGEADAVWTVEPYVTLAIGQGARVVAWNYADTTPDLTVALYFTSGKYAEAHADLVRRFTAALVESLQYATNHPAETRNVLAGYLKVDAPVSTKIVLPRWPAQVNRASVQRLADLARADGVLTKAVDVDSLLP